MGDNSKHVDLIFYLYFLFLFLSLLYIFLPALSFNLSFPPSVNESCNRNRKGAKFVPYVFVDGDSDYAKIEKKTFHFSTARPGNPGVYVQKIVA